MARIELSEGRWANLRPMLAKDEMLIGELAELEDARDPSGYFKVKARMVRQLDDATRESNWEGGFGELPKDETLTAILSWNVATEGEALPEGNAPSSETPPDGGR